MQAHAAEKNAAAGIRKRSSVNALGASAKRRKLMSRRRRQICRPYTGASSVRCWLAPATWKMDQDLQWMVKWLSAAAMACATERSPLTREA